MSWNVSATGSVTEVVSELEEQFSYPIGYSTPTHPANVGLDDKHEVETVVRVMETIKQVLRTYGPAQRVRVVAAGYLVGEADSPTRYQSVTLNIQPVA